MIGWVIRSWVYPDVAEDGGPGKVPIRRTVLPAVYEASRTTFAVGPLPVRTGGRGPESALLFAPSGKVSDILSRDDR